MNRHADHHQVSAHAFAAAVCPLRGFLFFLMIMGLLTAVTAPGNARLVMDEDDAVVSDPLPVFEMIATAWQDMDQQALADLVHDSGLKVTSGTNADRTTHYSPSQAFYYFKNMFQTHRTLLFSFEKMQDASGGDRVHGLAVWKRRKPDSERINELTLVCVLARQGDQWRLVEINKIR